MVHQSTSVKRLSIANPSYQQTAKAGRDRLFLARRDPPADLGGTSSMCGFF
jgi:hypothetical protein